MQWSANQELPRVQPHINPSISTVCWERLGGTTAYGCAASLHSVTSTAPDGHSPASTCTNAQHDDVCTRISMRANKGQTSKYDDFVQQITLKPGTYASDGKNLYVLEDHAPMKKSLPGHYGLAHDTAEEHSHSPCCRGVSTVKHRRQCPWCCA